MSGDEGVQRLLRQQELVDRIHQENEALKTDLTHESRAKKSSTQVC